MDSNLSTYVRLRNEVVSEAAPVLQSHQPFPLENFGSTLLHPVCLPISKLPRSIQLVHGEAGRQAAIFSRLPYLALEMAGGCCHGNPITPAAKLRKGHKG